MQKNLLILIVSLAFFGGVWSASAAAGPNPEETMLVNTMCVAPVIPELPAETSEQEIAQASPVPKVIKRELPEPTPVVTLQPTAAPADPQTAAIEAPAATGHDQLFEKYAAEYGITSSTLSIISKCESGHNPQALSSNQLYGGLFQFATPTWQSNRRAMGLDDNPSLRFNAEEAIKTAAFKISRDGVGAWPTCGKKTQQGA